jgi:replication factor C subunit 1
VKEKPTVNEPDVRARTVQPEVTKTHRSQSKSSTKITTAPIIAKKEPKLIPIDAKSFFGGNNKIVPKQPVIVQATPAEEYKGTDDIEMTDILESISDEIDDHMMELEHPDNTSRLREEFKQPVTIVEDEPIKLDNTPKFKNEEVKQPEELKNHEEPKPKTLSKQKRAFLETVNKSQGCKDSNIPISNLWTHKYNPTTIEDIIGNQDLVKKIVDWLKHWNDVVLNGNPREINETGMIHILTLGHTTKKNKSENVNARAMILSGPPGIGKTSTVRAIAKSLNYRTYEMNASDQRNKAVINARVGYLMDNTTISSHEIEQNNFIIMDEVDGMAGNEDKGGISALIDIIKKTKVPIVLICNDVYNQKLKSLINHCYDIKFNRPDKRLIVKRLQAICNKEGHMVETTVLDNLIESVGNDIRQCINVLEMRLTNSNLTPNKNNITSGKDSILMINAFDACKKLLTKVELGKLKFHEKMDLFYLDFDLVPSLIFVNPC